MSDNMGEQIINDMTKWSAEKEKQVLNAMTELSYYKCVIRLHEIEWEREIHEMRSHPYRYEKEILETSVKVWNDYLEEKRGNGQNYTKDEHGRFTGSKPAGGSGTVSSGKVLTNSDKSDTITIGDGGLKQAKKRDHKIYITDTAIEKVGNVYLSDFSNEQISSMQEKNKELLRIVKIKNNSNEILFISDLNFKSEIVVIGSEFNVAPKNSPFAVSIIAHSKRQELIYLHNHPSTNNFSIGDIDTFVCERAIKAMSVVTNQGEVYVLNKLKSYDFNKTKDILSNIFNSFPKGEVDDKEFVSAYLKRCGEGGVEYGKSK